MSLRWAFSRVGGVAALFLCSLALGAPGALASTLAGGDAAPTIVSDQADYHPGATVTLSGGNWIPGDAVHIVVNDSEGATWQHEADVTAAADGTLVDRFTLPSWFVATYTVAATGPLSGTATTSFTDSNVTFHAVSPAPPTWTVNYTTFSAAACGGSGTARSSVVTGAGPMNSAGGGQTTSLRLTSVTAISPGYAFDGFTSGTPSADSGTPIAVNACITASTTADIWAHFHLTDTTPPSSTASAGTYVAGTWTKAATVTVALSATDTGGTGVQSITYSASGAQTIATTTVSGSTANVAISNAGVTTVSYHATDVVGNVETPDKTFVVKIDRTAPVLTLPADQTREATSAGGAAVTFVATATDNADGTDPVTCTPASGSTFPIAVTTVSCSATDSAGNTATGTFRVTVRDTTPPALANVPANVVAEATSSAGAVVGYTKPTATDIVDGSVPVSCAPASGATFALGTTTVTCTATDAHANTGTATFTVTVRDTTAPVLSLPAPIVKEATGPAGATATYTTSASDLVDGAVAVTCSPSSGSMFGLGTTTVSCSATDAHGNRASGSFEVRVHDTTAPALSLPSATAAEATGPSGATVFFSATASDLVDGASFATCSPASGSTFSLGTTHVDCSATDAHGNTASGGFDVTVRDTTAPVLTLPADRTLEATGAAGADATFAVSASDAVDGPVAVSCSPASGSTFPLGTTHVECSTADTRGNTGTGGFDVTVRDTTAPALTLPADRTLEATGPGGATTAYTASAGDAVDGPVAVTCSHASGSTFALGTTHVVCSATDANRNTATGGFDVTVRDTTAPVLTLPDSVTAEATGAAGATVFYGAATATDLVDGTSFATCSPASGSTFPLGTTHVNCSASDAHGNTATGSFDVTVQDTTAPALLLPSPQTAEAADANGAPVFFSATADDLVDGASFATCSPASGSTFPFGTTHVSCSASDAHGNTATGSFDITVQDTTAPALTLPADRTLEATGADGAAASFAASAVDSVDGPVSTSCSPASGSTFAIGRTTVECTAADGRGNTARGSFTVTVRDTTAPVLSLPAPVVAEATGPAGAAVSYDATSSDAVDGAAAAVCTPASGATFALGTTNVSCSATDAHGNTADGSFTVTVRDTTAPSLSLPGSVTAEATGASGATVFYGTAAAADLVDGTSFATCSPASGTTFAIGTTHVACSASDAQGNTASGTFDVTVQDTTAPTLLLPSAQTAEAADATGATVFFSASASDLVDGSSSATCSPASGSTFALGTTHVRCSATDAHSNSATGGFDVTVQDTTAPALTLPADRTLEATGPDGAAASFAATASDAVDGSLTGACTPASASTFPLGTTHVVCSVADAHHNTASGSFTVTVRDTTAPVLSLPAPVVAEATGPEGAAVSYDATSSDAVDGAAAAVCTPASGATFALGATSVSCSATDAHGNTASGSFTVTVRDTTAPSLSLPGSVTAEATGASGATVFYGAATAADLVDGTAFATCSPASGTTFAIGTTHVVCSAADTHGNTASGTFDVTVRDTTMPALLLPSAQTAEAADANGATVFFSATASDLVDGSSFATCSPASGSTFPLGTTHVVCSATDAGANTATGSFDVTVVDTTAPVLTLPADRTLEATGADGAAASFAATATDAVDGSLAGSCSPASASTFPLGTTHVLCSVTDAHHNSASGSFTITVLDTTGPVVTPPDDQTLEATGPAGAVATFAASAHDLVDGTLAASCSPASGTTFALGTGTVTCSAADARGNAGSASFAVTVRDTTAPTLSLPSSLTAEASGASGAAVFYSAGADDLVDGASFASCSPASGSTFALGTTHVACSASDAHGNAAAGTFDVTVRDTTAPALSLPADRILEATGPDGAPATFAASAVDGVDGAVATACSPASGSTFALGTTSVQCSATDAHHNTASGSFTIAVRDTTAPALSLPASVVAEATGPAGAEVSYAAGSLDLVDGPLAAACAPASGSLFALGTTTVNCSATDAHGNVSTGSFEVTVRDTTKATLSLPAPLTAEAAGPAGATVFFSATADDLVDGASFATCSPASGSTFALGTTSVRCSSTDAHGNTASGAFDVTVQDTTAPALSLPANVVAEATGPFGANVSFSPTASDAVDGAVAVTCFPASGSLFSLGTTGVGCSATDAHHNVSTGSFYVTVRDTIAPALSLPDPIVAEATGPAGAAVSYTAGSLDIVDGSVPAACAPASGTVFVLGTTTVHCSAKDAHGNTSTGSFDVTVRDTTAPALSLPAPITAEASGPAGAVVSFAATAHDLVDGTSAATCSPASGSTFQLGTTHVSCSATDAHGNTARDAFDVTVQDTTKPVLAQVPADRNAEATSAAGAVVTFTNPTATDLVDGSVATACAPASGSTFALGTTHVDCTAADAHGNTATARFDVTVVDTTAPALHLPAPVVAEATGPAGAAVSYTATATDAVDGSDTVSCSPASGSTFSLGSATVRCSSTDAHGNAASGTFTVTVRDTTPPSVTAPDDLTVEATGPAGAAATFSAKAVDLVDGTVTASCSPASGSTFGLGTTTVTCSAADSRGNGASAGFKVTVRDTTPPKLTLPADITAEATSASGAAVSFSTSATDVVDGAVATSCTPSSGSTFAIGSTTVRCTATDAHGNTATGQFSVKVQDTTAPSAAISAPTAGGAYSATGANPWAAGSCAGICGSAADTASGVAKVEVSLQRSSDGSYWNGTAWVAGATWIAASGTTGWSLAVPAASFPADGTYVARARSTDAAGNVSSVASATFTLNAAPKVSAGGPYTGVEASATTLTGSATDTGALTYSWTTDAPAGICTFGSPTAVSTTFTCSNNGTFNVTLRANDGVNAAVAATAAVAVANANAVVTMTSPLSGSGFATGAPVTAAANFTDAGKSDTHGCSVNWGDNVTTTGALTESAGSGKCSATHSYATAGTYTIRVTVTDTADPASFGSATATVVAVAPTGKK